MAKRIGAWLIAVALMAAQTGHAQIDEYAAKAGLLYNLSRFVVWPELDGTIAICVLGEDPFGGHLKRFAGKKVGGNEITVRNISSVRNARECQILFVGPDRQQHIAAVAESVADAPTLIISDSMSSLEQGAMVVVLIEGGRIRFHVDNSAARRQGIAINAQVLTLAETVR